MRERDVENYLVKCVKDAGGEIRKVRWIGRVGAPDRFVMLYVDRPVVVWVELKSTVGQLSAAQHREIERFRQFGMKVWVVRSKEDVDNLMFFAAGYRRS